MKQSMAVWWDMLIKDLSDNIQRKSKEVVEIYEDVDEGLKND